MATFYEQPKSGGAPDYTGASKGFKSSTAVGDAFEGLGDTVKMGVTAADEYYKGSIKEEGRQASEELLDDYGVGAAVDSQTGTNNPATPTEIQQGFNRLQLLKQAQANGTLKESSFWAQAELISRQLKMRYPGHWEDVDSTMSSLLGRKPAQAVASALRAENEATASKADVERRSALNAARSAGLTDVFVREQQGKPFTTDQINTLVASRNAIKWDQEFQSRDYNLKKNRNELTENDVLMAQRTNAQTEFATMLSDTASPLFSSVQEYREYSKKLSAQRETGGVISPELQGQVKAAAQQVREQVNNMINKYTLQYAADAPADKLKDNISFLSNWADNYISAVEKGDLAIGSVNTAYLKSFQDYGTAKFLQSNDALRKHSALRTAMGEQPYSLWYTRNIDSKVVAERDIAIEDFMSSKSLMEGKPLNQTTNDMMLQDVRNPATFRQHVNKVLDAVVTDDIPDNLRTNAVESLFGEKNLNFLNESVSAEERYPMFLRMTNPRLIKSIKQYVDEGKLTSNDFDKFRTWMSTNALQLMHDNAAEINAVSTHRKSIDVYYDPDSHLLKSKDIEYKPTASSLLGRGIETMSEKFQKGSARTAILRADGIIRNMKTLMEQTGDNPDEIIPLMLEKAGINVSQPDITEKKNPPKTGAEPAVEAVEKGSAFIYEGFDKMGRPQGTPTGDVDYTQLQRALGF